MSWGDLLWLPPLMIAISIVIGASGRQGARTIVRAVWSTLVALTLGVLAVGVAIHLVAALFS